MSAWLDFLATQGAVLDADRVTHFDDPAAERQRTLGGAICCDLSPLSVLLVRGEDARDFLNAQFTADLGKLSGEDSTLTGWCDPKGRVLCVMLLQATADGFLLLLPRDQAGGICQRLRMYILRAKVTIDDISEDTVLLGLSGDSAQVSPLDCPVVRLPVPGHRQILVQQAEAAIDLWKRLCKNCHPVGWPCWELLDILAGLPALGPENSGEYLPQMLNLDALGGLSYQKGCYPGQEVIARLHHRGEVKRRLQLAFCPSPHTPAVNSDILAADGDKAGRILRAAPLDDDRQAVQIMLEQAHATSALQLVDGTPLELHTLPYRID